MKMIIGKDKFPLIQLNNDKFMHVVPITKMQFERYIWETAPEDVDYEKIISDDPRITPYAINVHNVSQLFVKGLSVSQVNGYLNWIGGRLPTKQELGEAYKLLEDLKIESIQKAAEAESQVYEIDKRFGFIINALCVQGFTGQKGIFKTIQKNLPELSVRDASLPNGEMFQSSPEERTFYRLTGNLTATNGFGFRVVLKITEKAGEVW
jgi:hypothetical protein